MKYLFILGVVFLSQLVFGFSEAEIDSLESSGKKSLSSSLWRVQVGVYLQRNLEVNSRFSDLLDTGKDTSLVDPSNLYYVLRLQFNHSLEKAAQHFSFLKEGEVFLSGSFNSPFAGHNDFLKGYDVKDYIQYGMGDVRGGLTVPTYKAGDFLSYFSLGYTPFALSRFSREAGLSATVDGAVNLLYFIHRGQGWSLAFSSNHSLAYSCYKKEAADDKGRQYNIPWDLNQEGGIVYRQSRSERWPSHVQVSAVHYFGVDTKSTRNHDVTVKSFVSWKIRDRLYLNFSVKWKDRVAIYNPFNKDVGKTAPVRFDLTRTFFILGLSWSL